MSVRISRVLPAVAVSIAIVFVSTACGAIGGNTVKSKSSGVAIDVGAGTVTPSAMKNIALILNNDLTATFSVALVDAAQKTAKQAGVNLDVKFDRLDAPTELANYQSVLASGKYQGVIIQPLTGQLCEPVKNDASSKNMPVIVVVTPLCTDTTDKKTQSWYPGTLSFVGGMNNRAHTVELMTSAAKDSAGPQKILRVVGTQAEPDTISFINGFDDFAETDPDWDVVSTVYTDFSTPDAFTKTQNALQGNPGVTMIVTSYAGITDGVVQAIASHHLTQKIAVYDQTGGSFNSVALVKSGKLTGTLPSYPASIGAAAVQALVDAGNGTKPHRFIDNDGKVGAAAEAVTKANIDSFVPQYH